MVSIQLVKVTKRFQNVEAVRDIDLEIPDGKFTALLGPSGSGKTTLLYLIAGIYKPTRGRILFDGRDVTGLKPNERNIGLVFQNYALYPHMTVYENISFPLRLAKKPKSHIDRKVNEVASMLQIKHLLDRYPSQLSGGQQQRVALARALVKEPSVLLLDEPLSNLDAMLRLRIRSELKRLQRDLGITAVYVTHDQSEALAMADKIVVIHNGVIQQEGDPHEVYRYPRNVFVASFIGSPPANIFPARVDLSEEPCVVLPGGKYCPRGILAERLRRLGKDTVLFGFRPEDVELVDAPRHNGGVVIEAEVYTVEPLGREVIVTVRIDGNMAKVLAPPGVNRRMGDRVYIVVPRDKIMLFDPDTEKNLRSLD
ncbi:MAG: ABC transporter ATP-binding protein [Desulfurococcales archaeon]|nr:ABC transporter ATP-binding protein [Desulfurococcales archaeon]